MDKGATYKLHIMNIIDLFGGCNQLTTPKRKIKKMVKSKQRTLFEYFWQDIFKDLPTDPVTKMPILKPFNGYIPERMLPFDEAYRKKETDCIVHFYEDDRRFLRIFRKPDKYLSFLKKCALIIEPDLSQFIDMPPQIRAAHAYLNRAIAVYLQQQGCNMVSNLTWSLRDSYEYSLSGRPQFSIVAVNCTGILGHDVSMYVWREGYKNIVLPLHPTQIIRYGDRMPDENTDISIYFDNERLKRLRHGS